MDLFASRWLSGVGRIFAFSLVLLSVTSLATAQEGAEAGKQKELETARLHFQNGVDLLQANPPNYQDAYRQFELAYEMSGGSWKVLGNLGLCALKLERDGQALKYYREYLDKGRRRSRPERAAVD